MTYRTLAVALSIVGLLPVAAAAGVIRYDAGMGTAPDPTTVDAYVSKAGTQNWTANADGASPFQAVTDGGTSAWQVADQTGNNFYRFDSIDASDITAGNTYGWTLKAIVRMPTSSVTDLTVSPRVLFADGSNIWNMAFWVDSGKPAVQVTHGSSTETYTLSSAADNSDFHTYELRYDPVSTKATLWIDGDDKITGLDGGSSAPTQVFFGESASSADSARTTNYNLVEWSVVPEPSAVVLLLAGLISLLAMRCPMA
jgi:hypothetical protein